MADAAEDVVEDVAEDVAEDVVTFKGGVISR
jgi:hypothetical protein